LPLQVGTGRLSYCEFGSNRLKLLFDSDGVITCLPSRRDRPLNRCHWIDEQDAEILGLGETGCVSLLKYPLSLLGRQPTADRHRLWPRAATLIGWHLWSHRTAPGAVYSLVAMPVYVLSAGDANFVYIP